MIFSRNNRTEQGRDAQITWARQRTTQELRNFVAEREGRLSMIDLVVE